MDFLIASPDVLLAQVTTYTLVSPIKPVLLLATIVPYMWVASKIEPDTRKYLLPVVAWNSILVGVAAVAFLVALVIPIFWIGWPVMILMLAGTLYGYWQYRNNKVPEHAKFSLISADLGKKMEERRAKKALAQSILKFFDPKGRPFPVPLKEAPEFPIHIAAESVLAPALERRASRVELVAAGANQPFVTNLLIDGVRYKGEVLAPSDGNAVIDYVKKIAGLDLNDRRRRQAADFKVDGPTRSALVTATTWGTSNGTSIRLDFDRAKSLQVSFQSLGLLPAQLDALKAIAEPSKRHGVILVSASAGQGLTTSCLSLIARHDAYTSNIKTLEKHIELQVEGVDHNQFNPANPTVDFATNLQSILRRDPDVVYISDVTEPNAGRIAAGPGLQGPLLYVGVQADSIAAAVSEWVRSVGDLKLAARGLVAVTHQRMMRKVCEACRQPLQATPDLLKKLGVPQGKSANLFRQNGKVQVKNRVEDCPVCQGLGYFGVTACFEIMFLDDTTRGMLAENDFKSAYAHARREGKLITLQEAAMAKVRDGLTTVDELARVFPPPKPPAASPAAKAS
ncbi:MAG: Flp pilus assembly complex ATPase component TadA [Phycisphaerae bacterium]|nr:Flp pilus assembly complex ATPase component TadA [Phycisphaerae bacterium]